jgi:hypothetical protein
MSKLPPLPKQYSRNSGGKPIPKQVLLKLERSVINLRDSFERHSIPKAALKAAGLSWVKPRAMVFPILTLVDTPTSDYSITVLAKSIKVQSWIDVKLHKVFPNTPKGADQTRDLWIELVVQPNSTDIAQWEFAKQKRKPRK